MVATKVITKAYPGLSKTEWVWPETDDMMWQGIFDAYNGDQDKILSYVPQKRVCIQAGGACGVWPLRFAQDFEWVYTFEPHPANWHCLMENIAGQKNITARHVALGAEETYAKIHTPSHKPRNHGVFYIEPVTEGPTVVNTIDAGEFVSVDLIQLDVEGGELDALKGAARTIEECKPVIVIENKPLKHLQSAFGHSPAAVVKYVCDRFKYKVVTRIAKDTLLMPK